ncbi:MAG: hypothetical protein M3Z24_01030, partial [Chloroflexota bacterium]|nr:hypothetical protein [Chloroflexota bacterium]
MTDQLPAEQVPDISPGQIAQQLDALIQAFEQHPIVQVREQVMEMLSLIDMLHRQGIGHLVEVLQSQEPTLFKRIQGDKAVHI